MPGFGISIPLSDIRAVHRELEGKGAKASDLTRPFKRFSIYYDGVVQKTFRQGGRPPGSWPQLSEYTLALRKWRGRGVNPRRMLDVHGAAGLRGSFNADVQPQGMKYGTNKPYASIHQQGGKVTRDAVDIKPKKKKALLFIGKQGLPIYATKAHLPARTFQVPQRKMITWLPVDEQELERLAEERMRE